MRDKLYYYKAKVLKVIDGDTMDVEIDLGFGIYKKERLRLVGIDTPEKHSDRPEEEKAAEAVRRWVENKTEGIDIYIRSDKLKKGGFGRYIAEVNIPVMGGEASLDETLIKMGFARKYFSGASKTPWDKNKIQSINHRLNWLFEKEEYNA